MINAQEDTALVRTYGGDYFEEGRQIIECASGGYAAVGTTSSGSDTDTDFYILRLDQDLHCMWNVVIGGPQSEKGMGIIEDAGGNILVTGFANDNNNGYDGKIVKLSNQGEILWSKNYGGTDWDFFSKITSHPDNGFLACGRTYSTGNGNADAYLVHIDDDGEIINEWTFGGTGEDGLNDLLVCDSNQIVFGGFTELSNDTISPWFFSVDINMEVQWEKIFVQYGNGECRDLSKANDGDIRVCGSFINDDDDENGFLGKYHPDGSLFYDQNTTDYTIEGIAEGEDFLYVIGNTSNFGSGGATAAFAMYEPNGSWLIGPMFGGVFDEYGFSILVDQNEAIVFVGSSTSYQLDHPANVYLVKINNPVVVSDYVLDIVNESCFAIGINEPVEEIGFACKYNNGNLGIYWKAGRYKVKLFNAVGQNVISLDSYDNGYQIHLGESLNQFLVVYLEDEVGNISTASIVISQ